MTGVELIAQERSRQIEEKGYHIEHDVIWQDEEQLALAASCYALPEKHRTYTYEKKSPFRWPWDEPWWKPSPKDRKRELIKAGALIAAEIDRLQEQERLDLMGK